MQMPAYFFRTGCLSSNLQVFQPSADFPGKQSTDRQHAKPCKASNDQSGMVSDKILVNIGAIAIGFKHAWPPLRKRQRIEKGLFGTDAAFKRFRIANQPGLANATNSARQREDQS